jgi:hypothetical protein
MSISAKAPNGTVYHWYAEDEVPNIRVVTNPPRGIITDTTYESPAFFSMPGRTLAKKWTVDNDGNIQMIAIPINAAQFEYIEFVTPAGVSWVMGLGDDGEMYVELFTQAGHGNRRIVSTLMHRGGLAWVADNRQPIPRRY